MHEVITLRDGAKTRIARFVPQTAPIGVVQMIHGFGEHIGHYLSVGEFFAANGFACVIHEQRGFGEMPGLTEKQRLANRGVVPSYETFFDDIEEVRGLIGLWFPGLPVVIFGHSMGGNIAINYILKHPNAPYAKAVFESPWLSLYKQPPGVVAFIAGVIGKLSATLGLDSKLDIDGVTRRKDEAQNFKDDKLFHDHISFRLYAAVVGAGRYNLGHAGDIKLPALLLCAGDDRIVSAGAIREFSRKAGGNVKFIEYKDGYHALHNDTISEQVLADILGFIKGDAKAD